MSYRSMHTKIRSNPRFEEMVGKRTRFAILLSLVVVVPYYAFMMVTAFNPGLLARPLADGTVITWGWPVAALLIVGGWFATGLYVHRANREFDAMTQQILKEAGKK